MEYNALMKHFQVVIIFLKNKKIVNKLLKNSVVSLNLLRKILTIVSASKAIFKQLCMAVALVAETIVRVLSIH